MNLFTAALGTIFGSIYFVLGDERVLIAAFVIFVVSSIAFTSLRHRNKEIISFLFAFMIVFFNYNLRSEALEFFDLQSYLNTHKEQVQLEIISEPRLSFFNSEFIVEAKTINPDIKDRVREFFLPYRFIAKSSQYKGLEIGDYIGLADKDSIFTLEKLKKDNAKFYKKDKVFYKLTNKNISYKSHSDSFITKLQKGVRDFYYANLSPENAQIVTSLALGSRVAELPRGFAKQLRNLGLGHFFAASGFHLLVLTLVITWIFRRLVELTKIQALTRLASLVTIIAVVIYTAMAGFAPSIVRSAVVIVAYLFLDLLERKGRPIKLLFYLAGLTLFIDPYTMFDLGFQFSYMATLAILVWTKPIEAKLKFIPKYFSEIISVTLAVQIFLLPLIMYYFQSLQPWTIVSNIVFAPILSLMTLCSFVGLSPVLEPLLNFFKYLLKYTDHLPYANVHTPIILESLVLISIVFIYLAYGIFKPEKESKASPIMSKKGLDYSFWNLIKEISNNFYTRNAILLSSTMMLIAINLTPPNVVRIEFKKGLPQNFNAVDEFMADKNSNYKYLKIADLDTLIIKKRSSLKALGELTDDLHEVNLLILPKLNSSDIYFETLIETTNPQFIAVGIKEKYLEGNGSKTLKIQENLKLIGSRSHTILNSGVLYLTRGKFWSIVQG